VYVAGPIYEVITPLHNPHEVETVRPLEHAINPLALSPFKPQNPPFVLVKAEGLVSKRHQDDQPVEMAESLFPVLGRAAHISTAGSCNGLLDAFVLEGRTDPEVVKTKPSPPCSMPFPR
jgi:hypothetical protein